jgi:hypothetical protein
MKKIKCKVAREVEGFNSCNSRNWWFHSFLKIVFYQFIFFYLDLS